MYDFDLNHWTELPKLNQDQLYFDLCTSVLSFNKNGEKILMVLMLGYGKV